MLEKNMKNFNELRRPLVMRNANEYVYAMVSADFAVSRYTLLKNDEWLEYDYSEIDELRIEIAGLMAEGYEYQETKDYEEDSDYVFSLTLCNFKGRPLATIWHDFFLGVTVEYSESVEGVVFDNLIVGNLKSKMSIMDEFKEKIIKKHSIEGVLITRNRTIAHAPRLEQWPEITRILTNNFEKNKITLDKGNNNESFIVELARASAEYRKRLGIID